MNNNNNNNQVAKLSPEQDQLIPQNERNGKFLIFTLDNKFIHTDIEH
jgi:hypothetical protein